jgi:hypothetical protein
MSGAPPRIIGAPLSKVGAPPRIIGAPLSKADAPPRIIGVPLSKVGAPSILYKKLRIIFKFSFFFLVYLCRPQKKYVERIKIFEGAVPEMV